MRRTILWILALTFAFAFRMPVADNRAAGQLPDPAPIGDEPGYEAELPSPPQSLDNSQQLRDLSHAYLGVTFDPQIRNAAVARSVSAGSPADLAGVRAGDTIVSLNGRRVASYDEVLNTVDRLKPGDVLDIDVSRRISVRARAVLDGQPLDGRRTSNYRVEVEPLPVPAEMRNRQRSGSTPNGNNTVRPRQNYNGPQDRPGSVNRNERPTNRERGFRDRGRSQPRRS